MDLFLSFAFVFCGITVFSLLEQQNQCVYKNRAHLLIGWDKHVLIIRNCQTGKQHLPR